MSLRINNNQQLSKSLVKLNFYFKEINLHVYVTGTSLCKQNNEGKKKHYSFVAANPEDSEMEIFFFSPKKRKKKKDTFMKASVTWTLHFYQMLLCWTLQHDTTLGHMCPAARIYDEGKEN